MNWRICLFNLFFKIAALLFGCSLSKIHFSNSELFFPKANAKVQPFYEPAKSLHIFFTTFFTFMADNDNNNKNTPYYYTRTQEKEKTKRISTENISELIVFWLYGLQDTSGYMKKTVRFQVSPEEKTFTSPPGGIDKGKKGRRRYIRRKCYGKAGGRG